MEENKKNLSMEEIRLENEADILLYIRYCGEGSAPSKAKEILFLWNECSVLFFGSSADRGMKLVKLISDFEIKYEKTDKTQEDFNNTFDKIFPQTGLNKLRIQGTNLFKIKQLIGYTLKRNAEHSMFLSYKSCSEETKNQILNALKGQGPQMEDEKLQSQSKNHKDSTESCDKRYYTTFDPEENVEDRQEERLEIGKQNMTNILFNEMFLININNKTEINRAIRNSIGKFKEEYPGSYLEEEIEDFIDYAKKENRLQ